jgi:type II restriction enzyme
MTVDEIKALLQELNFPSRQITEQTVFCILALANTAPRQGLLVGHTCLADGARIHDILNFVRQDIGRPVAENTRESYRKASLRPLMEAGWVIRHQLSTNAPNTYYRLRPSPTPPGGLPG